MDKYVRFYVLIYPKDHKRVEMSAWEISLKRGEKVPPYLFAHFQRIRPLIHIKSLGKKFTSSHKILKRHYFEILHSKFHSRNEKIISYTNII